MRLSLELKLTWKVLVIFFILFSFVGLILHYIYLVYLKGFLYFFYGFVGMVFLLTLSVVQRGYLAYYGIKSKRDAKELIESGGKPSDILLRHKGIKAAEEITEITNPQVAEYTKQVQQSQAVSENDLKRIAKEMKKKARL
jgi:hypothetical protein